MELLSYYFNAFEKSAQRIETLPEYNISNSNERYFNYNSGNF